MVSEKTVEFDVDRWGKTSRHRPLPRPLASPPKTYMCKFPELVYISCRIG